MPYPGHRRLLVAVQSGLIGSFHQVSIKHLQRDLNEFSFRFNNRQNEEIFALVVLGLVIKDRPAVQGAYREEGFSF